MKRIRRFLTTIMFSLIFCLSPIITGCFSFGDLQLKSPEIQLHESSLCLTWSRVINARQYAVYCNDELVDTVQSNIELSSYIYDISPLLSESGTYNFHMIAVANKSVHEDSEPSNKIEFAFDARKNATPIPQDTSVNTVDDIEIVFNINRGQIDIINGDLKSKLDKYEVYLYSQNTGLNIYPEEISNDSTTHINFLNYELKDEIYAVRIGGVIGDEHFVCSDIRYINPDAGEYTEDKYIYMFDGYINDMYIESLSELRNLVYYAYIYREPEIVIRLSNSFKEVLANFEGNSMPERLGMATLDCFNYFMETMDAFSVSTKNLQGDHVWQININFDEEKYLNNRKKSEPEVNNKPTTGYYADLERDDKFYETCGYTMRDKDEKYSEVPYDDFVSDRQFLYTEVESSEELYWAVENKITPITKAGSMSETIYNTVKTVLNSIISDQMTDYEKVVSIFDWICANTKYDYYALQKGSYNNAPITLVPVYYLEGVFINGFAVCDGFSKAFSLMCNMEGIDAMRIVGKAWTGDIKNGQKVYGGHAWNKVKLDKDPTDEVEGKYYLVDITWTTFLGYYYVGDVVHNDKEIATHSYFLTDDFKVSDSHLAFASRPKFRMFSSPESYDYYEYTKFNYNDKEFDLVITSAEELESMFLYMYTNKIKTFEAIIDYEFLKQNYIDVKGYWTASTEYNKIIEALTTTMINKKIAEQYFLLNQEYWATTIYNGNGDEGLLLVFEHYLLIDAQQSGREDVFVSPNIEAGHIISKAIEYNNFGEFDLFVDNAVLKTLAGSDSVLKVKNLFEKEIKTITANLDYDITVTVTQQSNLDKAEQDKSLFKIVFEKINK